MNLKTVRLMLVVIVVFLIVPFVVTAQEDDDFVPSPALVEQMDGLEAAALRLRQLDRLESVTRIFPTRDDVRAMLNEDIDDEEVTTFYSEASQFYIAFDFLPEGTDLLALLIDFLDDQIGGFYDPETNEMNTVLLTGERPSDRLPLTEQITFVHEYVHALQDQHFDLIGLIEANEVSALGFNTDQGQAIIALYEGDATAAMSDYTLEAAQDNPLGALVELLAQGAAAGTLVIPPNIPDIVENELLSPYLDGQNFVTALRNAGGWALVNAAYENLPQSSEHILHPDKYLSGEAPIAVELAAGADDDGLTPLGEGWTLLFDRTLGEWYLRQYLRTQLDAPTTRLAATGWGGDRYHLFYNAEADQRAFVLRLVWDTPLDSEEFAGAYMAFGDARFGESVDDNLCWVGESDVICVDAAMSADDGSYTTVIYAPTVEIAETLRTHYR